MSENNSTQPQPETNSKQYLLAALVILLVGIVGFQAWYMMSMKQQMETIQGMVSPESSIMTGTAAGSSTAATQIAQLSGSSPVVPSPSTSQAPSSPVANTPSIAQQIQKNLNAQAQAGQQGQAILLDPPSVFDDDFFNRPFDDQNWNPYEEIQRMQRDMDRMFNHVFSLFNSSPDFQPLFKQGAATPGMDVKEDAAKYTVVVNLPGADEKNISVNLEGQQLTVRGEQNFSQQKKDALGNVIFQKRHTGTFQRSITLPEPVKQNGMVTNVDHGVLTITVPKVS